MIQRIVSLIALILIMALAASPGATAQEGPAGNFYLRRAQEDPNFPVRFSVNFGSTVTAECVNEDRKGCKGILDSAKSAVAVVISRETSAKLHLQPSTNMSESKEYTTLTSGSVVVFGLNNGDLPYLTFSFLIDVRNLVAGSELEDVEASVVSAVNRAADDQSLIEDISNFMKMYDDFNGIENYHMMLKGGQSSSFGQETVFKIVELMELNEEASVEAPEEAQEEASDDAQEEAQEIQVDAQVETEEPQVVTQEKIPPSEEVTEAPKEVQPEAVITKAAEEEEEEEEEEPMHLVTKLMLIGSFGFLFCMIPSKVWK
mmetsp:Transcript_41080/g.80414  ORF Transcript_41080/g.80414 Transcript_41080/m.80414 type:complete len:316 (-) Transcript_41080:81-1028(-)